MNELKRFFSPAVADAILSTGGQSILALHRREICYVFVDLRGFTAFTEGERGGSADRPQGAGGTRRRDARRHAYPAQSQGLFAPGARVPALPSTRAGSVTESAGDSTPSPSPGILEGFVAG